MLKRATAKLIIMYVYLKSSQTPLLTQPVARYYLEAVGCGESGGMVARYATAKLMMSVLSNFRPPPLRG